MTIEISRDNWEKIVGSSKSPVLVDFWAPWCPWCMRLMPVFEEVSGKYEDKLTFAKVNVEEQQEIAQSNGILGIPVMKMYCQGKNVGELVGFMNKEKIIQEIDKLLSSVSECISQTSTWQKK